MNPGLSILTARTFPVLHARLYRRLPCRFGDEFQTLLGPIFWPTSGMGTPKEGIKSSLPP